MSTRKHFTTGDGRKLTIDDISRVYRDVVSLSIPYSGKIQRLGRNDYSLTCHFAATDCDISESVVTTKSYSLRTTSGDYNNEKYIEWVRCITDFQALSEIAVTSSNNGRFLARLKLSSDNKQLLEIWERSKLLKTIDTSSTHGMINTDPVFASFRWSPFGEQDKLLYVCQKKKSTLSNSAGEDGIDRYAKREFSSETPTDGMEHTIVVILDVGQGFTTSLLDIEGFNLADSRWLSGLRTVSVAYAEPLPKLPLMMPKCAPSKLVVHDWKSSTPQLVCELEDGERCYTSPRVDNSGRRFLYCVTPSYGLENQPIEIYLHDLETSQGRKLEDHQSKQSEHFMLHMSDNCFTPDDKQALFMKHDHLYQQMCLFSLETSTITQIKFPTTGIHLLDFVDGIILAVGSEVNATPTLFVSVLSPADAGRLVAWHQIEECLHLNEVEYELHQIPTSDGSTFISGLLITPNLSLIRKNFPTNTEELASEDLIGTEFDLPTVISTHGAPQPTCVANYMHIYIVFARLGLRSLLINYRGSSGVNNQHLNRLCGYVCKVDVDDCLDTIRHFINNKMINREKLILYGGSYGGFLSCQISCQDQYEFSSAILWNPLVDMSLFHDKRFANLSLQKPEEVSYVPGYQNLTKMFEGPPISQHSQAHVPTLILLSSRDTCAPKVHGKMWFKFLEAKGVKTRCKFYEDGHSLSKAESQIDSTITAISWILSNLESTQADQPI